MLYLGREDTQMIVHVKEVIGGCLSSDDTYSPEDLATADKLSELSTPSLVIDGSELDDADAVELMANIVRAELANWVPNASQRLLSRAGAALGIEIGPVLTDNPDCGAGANWHALVSDWTAGIFVRRCVTCGRLYQG